MSTHRIRFQILAALGATALSCPATAGAERRAEVDSDRTRPQSSQTQPARSTAAPANPRINPASTLTAAEPVTRVSGTLLKTLDDCRGQTITGVSLEVFGTLDDFMVDTVTGKVVYAVIKSGGTDGVRLVQQSSLRSTPQGFRAEIDRDAFNQLEVLTTAQLDATPAVPVPGPSQRLSSEVEQQPSSPAAATTPAIGLLPPSAADSVAAASTAAAAHPDAVTPATTQPVEVTAAPSTGPGLNPPQRETHLARASQLKGKAVHRGDRPLGIIEAIGLDLTAGQAVAIFQLAGRPTGADTKFYLPISLLQFGAANEPASTALTDSDFEQAQPWGKAPTKVGVSVNATESLSPTGRSQPRSVSNGADRVDHDRANSGPGISATPGTAARPTGNTASPIAGPSNSERGVGPSSASVAGGHPRDETNATVAAVRAALHGDPALVGQDIDVQQAGNVIILRGGVASPELKERAELIVRKYAGDGVVDNSLSIQKRE